MILFKSYLELGLGFFKLIDYDQFEQLELLALLDNQDIVVVEIG